MDENLMNLRRRVIDASLKYLRAQRVFLVAIASDSRKSETELIEAAEYYLKSAEPYDAALQDLREYLLVAEPSEMVDVELDHAERLINSLDRETRAGSMFIKSRIKLTRRQARVEGK
jgi:hypothetical protein